MKILFTIGGYPIHLFGLTIALGIMAGYYVMLREAKRKGLDTEKTSNLAFYVVAAALVGARVLYIIAFNPAYYLKNPLHILMIQQGGISIQGALVAGVIFAYWYVKRHQLPFWKTADAFAPAIILGQAIGRVGCDVFGVPMEGNWFWGVQVNGQLLHPAQLYEAMLNFLLFFLLWQKRKSTAYDGQLFILYMAGFSLNRMIVEFFRTNPQVFGPISIAHVFSFIMIGVTLMVGKWLQKKKQEEEKPQVTGGNDAVALPVMEWKMAGVVLTAMVLSVMLYYYIHSL